MSKIRVAGIYDNLGKTLDRYTVLTDWVEAGYDPMHDEFMYLGMSENGHGFSQWGGLPRPVYAGLLKKSNQEFRAITHLGHLVPFEKLTADAQMHIARRILTEEV